MAISQQPKHLYEFGSFRLDAGERQLLRDGEAVSLTPKAFDLLLTLVEHHGRLLEKEDLFKAVWPDSFVEESNLSSNIALIRKALGRGAAGGHFIETVPKRGYRFLPEVRKISQEFPNKLISEKAQSSADAASGAMAPPQPQRRGGSRWAQPILFLALGALISAVGWRIIFKRSSALPPLKITPFTSFVGRETQPSFSPDGDKIAFAWNGENDDNSNIYVKQVGTEALLRLTTNLAEDTSPLWSPDGRAIAFTRFTGESVELYVVSPLGGLERKIADRREIRHWVKSIVLHASDWSPDSKWLAISEATSSRDPVSLFLLSPESGEKRRITTPPTGTLGDSNGVFSPDGKTMAFVRYGSSGDSDLYLASLAGAAPRRLTFDNARIMKLAWMPDGREILFLSNRSGGGFSSLWRIPAAGGTPTLVESAGTDLTGFAISRRLNRLAWSQTIADTNVWQIELAGTTTLRHPAKTLISSTRQDVSPQFSPDGRKIVFASNRTGNWEIWVCDSDGHNAAPLTSFNRLITGSPRWSPDGRQIVFDARAEDVADIYVVNVEGGAPRRLTTEPSEDIVPSWSHDGQWIYFCSNRNGSQQIWKMPAKASSRGGQAVQVTKQGGFDNVESPDGQYLYYAKGRGESGIWRIPVAGGPETPVLDHHQAGLTRQWAVTPQGIWFVTSEAAKRPLIEFYSFGAGRVTIAATLEKPLPPGISGLTISPDGRRLIWTQMDQVNSDITLAENFH
ncbi:MAG TPA: winged helix-turn-helix domain-containing protein [Blastocatellia bacterium]|jgi:Tol biopolymer transport system component/DNA-binding winged helix-turn-helix (wHTH) protein|nr:winged helix-turn-helix domain-containing protein [Blastocatellia bacterium]